MTDNSIYDHMHTNSVPLETISEGYVKNVSFISLRIALVSFFRTAITLDKYMNDVSVLTDMTQDKKDKNLGVAYAHEAYNAVFHYQNFMELAIKEIRYELTNDEKIYEKTFVENLDNLVAGIDDGTVPEKYHFIKEHYYDIRAINKLRNESVHSGVYILRCEALNELFGKYALPLMMEISRLPLFSGILYWKYNLDNTKVHPIEDIIEEYKKGSVDEYKIQLLKHIAAAAFDNEIYITKQELQQAQPDIFQTHPGFLYELLFAKRVKKAEKEAQELSELDQMDAHVCPVCQNKTLVLEQEYVDDENDKCYKYTYRVHCTQCGFKLDHYLINKINQTGVAIEDYSKYHS